MFPFKKKKNWALYRKNIIKLKWMCTKCKYAYRQVIRCIHTGVSFIWNFFFQNVQYKKLLPYTYLHFNLKYLNSYHRILVLQKAVCDLLHVYVMMAHMNKFPEASKPEMQIRFLNKVMVSRCWVIFFFWWRLGDNVIVIVLLVCISKKRSTTEWVAP